MLSKFKPALKLLLFFGLGAGILFLLYRNLSAAYSEQCRLDGIADADCSLLDKVIADFRSTNFGWLLAVVAAFTISNVSRSLRWLQLVEPLGHRARFSNAFWTIQLGYFANLGFPRAGELVRAASFARYENLPLEKTVGTLVVDRLMDFVCLAVILVLGIAVEGRTILDFIERQRQASTGGEASFLSKNILALCSIAVILIIALSWALKKQIARSALFSKLKSMALGFSDGLRTVFSLKRPGIFLLHSAIIWACYFLQTYFCLKAFDPTAHLSAAAALMVFLFGTLGVVVPSPGGMGTYHLLAMAALSLYGISRWDSFSLANIMFFTVQIFYMILLGLASLVILPLLNKPRPTAGAG